MHTIQFGIPTVIISHVVRMVALTPVPEAPAGIAGIMNYHGNIIPVFSLRRHFSLPERKERSSDYLLVIKKKRTLAVIAETINQVSGLSGELVSPETIYPGIGGITGVYRSRDGIVVIADPDTLFSVRDEEQLRRIIHPDGI
ncbi:MAG: chemotaxis protein CheW [Methanospirillum sp.]|nr:chemotaxis protein CheW [Methanospirillum sp.]